MLQFLKIKDWLDWPLIRGHLCTLAVSISFNATWRVPRAGSLYGGIQFALALTAALLLVLPLVLLQLAIGQLSQQDAVGVWRAVPIFKGVGYLRLLTSFMGSLYVVIYLALTIVYFLYTLSNSIPFPECTDYVLMEDSYVNTFNSSECLNFTFMSPVTEKPEYFVAMVLILLFIWITLPFILYNPVKLMRRVFYCFGPLIVVLSITAVAGLGGSGRFPWFAQSHNWANFLYPDIWYAAVTQALLTSEIAGGYLISAGDSIYSNSNVQWTAVVFIATNIVVSWAGLLAWFGACGDEPGALDTGPAAVLVQLYHVADTGGGDVVWPMFAFAALIFSGVITMLVRLYPIYERIRRVGSARWRVVCAGSALVCAGMSVAVLAGHWTSLHILEDVAVPLLASIATVLEVLAFVFIYGWKALTEDIEFLTGNRMRRLWVVGLCAVPVMVAPVAAWWVAVVASEAVAQWAEPPWTAPTVIATAAVAFVVLLVMAVVTVARQVQYDIVGKLKSSFKPSRHWGPRDPITHYYWLARRDEAGQAAGGGGGHRYRRRELGQLSSSPSFLNALPVTSVKEITRNEPKRRANSDDWVYTVYRRKYLEAMFPECSVSFKKCRSKSLDWVKVPKLIYKRDSLEIKIIDSSAYATPIQSGQSVNAVNCVDCK